ncbi:flavodoxin family protein [Denitrobaculum tricleocarpae]|uniref:Flavodoxin-like domain-containing protein n=1 Tax=Denitrobaculum tricleocarpae TaxID=2591009 RepID=A0A545TYD2_9PROT|nr:hypothetical protein [Denitrobaculum tricleocarpae]TQV82236.1 hypothetical protein FKG95_08440 [Denitrobaculum tricleocarpae]
MTSHLEQKNQHHSRTTMDAERPLRVLIIYYSRTGTTKKLAKVLAEMLNADLAEIRCDRYRPGIFRYLRAGYDSVRIKLPPIRFPPMAPHDYDLVLIGGPVWTSYPALPLRSFLAHPPGLPPRIGLFLTYGGHSDPVVAFEAMAASLSQPVAERLAVKAQHVADGSYVTAARAFAEVLSKVYRDGFKV